MAFSDIERQRIKNTVEALCSRRGPAHLRDQLRFEYDIDKQHVCIYEVRPVWNNPSQYTRTAFAKLTYVKSQNIWKLYWKRASGKWERYEPLDSDKDLAVLVREIDADPYGCFFG